MKPRLFDNPYDVHDHPIAKEVPGKGRGTQRLYKFPNGYGASVVRFGWKYRTTGEFHYASFTSSEEEWELAVVKWEGDTFHLEYSTGITEDVIGHLKENDVEKYLRKIAKL